MPKEDKSKVKAEEVPEVDPVGKPDPSAWGGPPHPPWARTTWPELEAEHQRGYKKGKG